MLSLYSEVSQGQASLVHPPYPLNINWLAKDQLWLLEGNNSPSASSEVWLLRNCTQLYLEFILVTLPAKSKQNPPSAWDLAQCRGCPKAVLTCLLEEHFHFHNCFQKQPSWVTITFYFSLWHKGQGLIEKRTKNVKLHYSTHLNLKDSDVTKMNLMASFCMFLYMCVRDSENHRFNTKYNNTKSVSGFHLTTSY